MNNINSKIAEARKAANLSQAKMSDLLEIPRRTIENWETGKRVPPAYVERLVINELNRIAKEKEAD